MESKATTGYKQIVAPKVKNPFWYIKLQKKSSLHYKVHTGYQIIITSISKQVQDLDTRNTGKVNDVMQRYCY